MGLLEQIELALTDDLVDVRPKKIRQHAVLLRAQQCLLVLWADLKPLIRHAVKCGRAEDELHSCRVIIQSEIDDTPSIVHIRVLPQWRVEDDGAQVRWSIAT